MTQRKLQPESEHQNPEIDIKSDELAAVKTNIVNALVNEGFEQVVDTPDKTQQASFPVEIERTEPRQGKDSDLAVDQVFRAIQDFKSGGESVQEGVNGLIISTATGVYNIQERLLSASSGSLSEADLYVLIKPLLQNELGGLTLTPNQLSLLHQKLVATGEYHSLTTLIHSEDAVDRFAYDFNNWKPARIRTSPYLHLFPPNMVESSIEKSLLSVEALLVTVQQEQRVGSEALEYLQNLVNEAETAVDKLQAFLTSRQKNPTKQQRLIKKYQDVLSAIRHFADYLQGSKKKVGTQPKKVKTTSTPQANRGNGKSPEGQSSERVAQPLLTLVQENYLRMDVDMPEPELDLTEELVEEATPELEIMETPVEEPTMAEEAVPEPEMMEEPTMAEEAVPEPELDITEELVEEVIPELDLTEELVEEATPELDITEELVEEATPELDITEPQAEEKY